MPQESFPTTTVEKKEAGPAWSVESVIDAKKTSPVEFHPERGYPTKFSIEHSDGSAEIVDSSVNVFELTSPDKTRVEVPAFAVHHIESLHLKGEEAGSTMDQSLEDSLRLVAGKLPEQLPFDASGAAAFEVEVGQPTGAEGVTSQAEMLAKGVATPDDVSHLSQVKEEVFRLNLSGTDAEKQALVESFNAQFAGKNVKLGIRGGSIAPFFIAELQPTSKMFVVVGKETDPDQTQHNRVWTMAPGRFMTKLPTDRAFTGVVSGLLERSAAGEALTPQEQTLVDQQRAAQECWWNGGFIVPPEKPAAQPVEQPAPAPQEAPEQVGEHMEDYASLEDLFLVEHLDENFDAVKRQLEQLREYIQQYNKDNRQLADDPGMEMYVDEHIANISHWFKEFRINGKQIDISDLVATGLYEDKFNEIVDNINKYKEESMIGSEQSDVRGM